jgi:hypothetical protein
MVTSVAQVAQQRRFVFESVLAVKSTSPGPHGRAA